MKIAEAVSAVDTNIKIVLQQSVEIKQQAKEITELKVLIAKMQGCIVGIGIGCVLMLGLRLIIKSLN